MANKRDDNKWELNFKGAKLLMGTLDKCDSIAEVENLSTLLRNPIIFDNNVVDVKTLIPYSIPKDFLVDSKSTEDHLVGTSNMVLYIYTNKLHKSWKSVADFKSTIKSLNVLMRIPKKLNDMGKFKTGWLFSSHNINECVRWDNKLKSVGITHLICNTTDNLISVDDVWSEWYNDFRD
jgi:hypothetical protein